MNLKILHDHENAFHDFYHGWDETKRYIGLDKRIADLKQIQYIHQNTKIDEELYLFTNVTSRTLWPSGNYDLTVEKDGVIMQDDFSHEQYLVISSSGKNILISGCAHNGILNILEEYKNIFSDEPDIVVSGFHMMKKNGYQKEDIEIIEQTAQKLKEYKTKFYTCHCTGEEPYERMKQIMGDQIEYIRSGEEILFDEE